jgi:hypothetical protein
MNIAFQEEMERKADIQERPQNSEVIERYFDGLKKALELSIVNLSLARGVMAERVIFSCYGLLMRLISDKYCMYQGNPLHERIYTCKFLRNYGRHENICDHRTLDLKRVIADEINDKEHDEFFDNCHKEFPNDIERYFPLMISFLQLDPKNIKHTEIKDKVFYHNSAKMLNYYRWFEFLEQIENIHNNNTIQGKSVLDDFIKEANGDEISSYNRRQRASETRTRYYNKLKVVLSSPFETIKQFQNVLGIVSAVTAVIVAVTAAAFEIVNKFMILHK